MECCAANTTTLELTDASGAVLNTGEIMASALLQRFVQQSNQNDLDERSAVWKGLDRTPTEASLNDDLITEQESTETFSRLYCPGHAGVSGNERAERLTRTADITSGL